MMARPLPHPSSQVFSRFQKSNLFVYVFGLTLMSRYAGWYEASTSPSSVRFLTYFGIGHVDTETGVRLDDHVRGNYDVRIAAERCEPAGYAFKNGHAAYLCRKCTLQIPKKRGRLATL